MIPITMWVKVRRLECMTRQLYLVSCHWLSGSTCFLNWISCEGLAQSIQLPHVTIAQHAQIHLVPIPFVGHKHALLHVMHWCVLICDGFVVPTNKTSLVSPLAKHAWNWKSMFYLKIEIAILSDPFKNNGTTPTTKHGNLQILCPSTVRQSLHDVSWTSQTKTKKYRTKQLAKAHNRRRRW